MVIKNKSYLEIEIESNLKDNKEKSVTLENGAKSTLGNAYEQDSFVKCHHPKNGIRNAYVVSIRNAYISREGSIYVSKEACEFELAD
jgi:hypothetical protein